MKVEEQGLYILWAYGNHYGQLPFSASTGVQLNVTESAATVETREVYLESEPPPPPYRPYLVKMDLDGVPALNRTVNLRVTIASLMDQKNATFRIFLPDGFELVSGDLVWHGDLQKGIGEGEIRGLGVAVDKIPEALLGRIPEGKKVRMWAIIRATRTTPWPDARIFVYPSQEPPSTVDCTLEGLNIPHPLIGKEVNAGWLAVSHGGCLNIRVFNETYAIFSEQKLPLEPRPPKPPPPPEPPRTPHPGMMLQT